MKKQRSKKVVASPHTCEEPREMAKKVLRQLNGMKDLRGIKAVLSKLDGKILSECVFFYTDHTTDYHSYEYLTRKDCVSFVAECVKRVGIKPTREVNRIFFAHKNFCAVPYFGNNTVATSDIEIRALEIPKDKTCQQIKSELSAIKDRYAMVCAAFEMGISVLNETISREEIFKWVMKIVKKVKRGKEVRTIWD